MRLTRFLNVMFLLSSAVFFIVFVSSGIASAAIIEVTNTNDSGAGSLRQAMQQAMSDAPGDVIDITATGTIVLQGPLLPINQNLTIKGPGAASLKVSGAGSYQVFNIISGTVDISGLTVMNGSIPNAGGGIYNLGTLTLTDCTVSGNSAVSAVSAGGGIFSVGALKVTNCTFSDNTANLGGGIASQGTLTVTNCTFSDNKLTGDYTIGGGIFSVGTLKVANCTFSGNSATNGGGIFKGRSGLRSVSGSSLTDTYAPSINGPGTSTVTNCTFSGNSATTGGGICNGGTLTVTNCTLSDNTATSGGGIYNGLLVTSTSGDTSAALNPPAPAPALGVENTIMANNSGGNCAGTVPIVSNGYNLEYGDNPATCNFTQATDLHANPLLDPNGLQNNGGPTRTIALLAGSPAIDAADPNNFPSTDQRGVIRPQGAGPDIGAYEYFPPSTPVPAMDGWGAIVFIILAGLGSVYYLRRRGRAEG